MRLSHLVTLLLKLFLTYSREDSSHARGFLPSTRASPEHPVLFDSNWAERARQTGKARLSATMLSELQSLRVINGPGGAAVSTPWCS